ncbi:MAG TPA: PhzF family phenazine biosynthesis protein [Steroidobacteraceae bacterium]|jgi:trans-2,3-dihydro-3-hydroxyanthranilate isomerase|nr:PhzF family phenazine biosynthesis protein [Steroidobacteraceae bacterium]
MATHPFRIVNVFTQDRGALSGNPLCVFEDGSGFDTDVMQALARQFNLSETTFILPSSRADARVRIFTPTYEMPFAGHPTLGTAHVCRALRLGGEALRLEMAAGVIGVRAQGDRWTLTAPTPTWREFDASRSVLAQALGVDERDIGERPLWMKAGKEQLVVPLTSVDAVRRASPEPQALPKLRSEDGASMAYVFAMKDSGTALARFFFQQGPAILEDPATGSATANFGGWCLAMQRMLPVEIQISQGEFVGRPSSLYLEVSPRGEILVGGDVIELGGGAIGLD